MRYEKMSRAFFLFVFISLSGFAQQPFTVVELFTSEGCSSCPPADELLNNVNAAAIKEGKNIFILAYHVDYWNRLGWKDPYSKLQFTKRQENYSRVLPEKEMYTPQVVINGKASFIGSKRDLLNENINAAFNEHPKESINIQRDSLRNDTIYLSYKISNTNGDYVLRIAFTESGLISNVTKGENAGKHLKHDCVVRSFTSYEIPAVTGNLKILANVFSGNISRKIIAFIQQKKDMHIVAAVAIDFPPERF